MVGRRADGCDVFRSAGSVRLIQAFEAEPSTTGERDFDEGCSGCSAGLEREISNVATFVCIPRVRCARTDMDIPVGSIDYQVKYGITARRADTTEIPDYAAETLAWIDRDIVAIYGLPPNGIPRCILHIPVVRVNRAGCRGCDATLRVTAGCFCHARRCGNYRYEDGGSCGRGPPFLRVEQAHDGLALSW